MLWKEVSRLFTNADRTLSINYEYEAAFQSSSNSLRNSANTNIFEHDKKSVIKWQIDIENCGKLCIMPVNDGVNKIFKYVLSLYVNGLNVYGPEAYDATVFQYRLSATQVSALKTINIFIAYPPEALVYSPKQKPIAPLPKIISKTTSREEFCDVKFVVENQTIAAHRHILADRSEVFRNIFLQNTANNEPIPIEDGMSYNSFYNYIDTIYYGTIPTDPSICVEMSILADKYDTQDIKKAVECFAIASINMENALNILVTSYKHKADRIKKAALEFCSKHPMHEMSGIKELAKFPDLMVEVFKEINLTRTLGK